MANYTPLFEEGERRTYSAGAAIAGGQLVYFSADLTVSPTTGATGAWIGVAGHDAASGALVTVYKGGTHLLVASGAIAVGANVIPAASGQVATIGADASDGANIVGVAEKAAAGGFVQVSIR
jgi:hypothetical protein